MRVPNFARWGLMAGLLALATVLRAETLVFADGRALLPVYVAADAAADEKLAAEELARVLGVMSGLAWPVQVEPKREGAGFFVGRTAAAARALPALRVAGDWLAPRADEVGPDGFRIRTERGRVFIEGATPEATPYAVSWLLQREAGARWFAPGPLGEVIPRRTRWALRDLALMREPAYVSREISGLPGTAGREWARRNGLRQRLHYSHHLDKVFTPEVYDAHPEWFGLVRGERRRPRGGNDHHWQPDLARPEVAAFAAARAAEAFARDNDAGTAPRRASFSLGMNDTVRFDQGEGTQAAVTPLRYFRGGPDYAPLVFGFMNRAAAELGRLRPEARGEYLGCLAYFWCEDVPPFPVDARVVPYVTTDRTQFYDAAYRAGDLALMARWGRSGVKAFGLWEYAEGNAYVVPRVPQAALAEAVREGWWRGARGYMGECGPHAGFDAYKIWMLAQLLWEPARTDAELEAEFFPAWYGPAEEPMRRFFARCEEVWMAQDGPPWWIKYYQQTDQVLLFPPAVCRELRALLDEARDQAEGRDQGTEGGGARQGKRDGHRGGDFGARVALTSRAFAVTEAAVAFDALRRELNTDAAMTFGPAELGAHLAEFARARAALERAVAEATAGDTPALATANIGYLLRQDPVPRLLVALARGGARAPETALAEARSRGGEVPAHWSALAAAGAGDGLRWARNGLANSRFTAVAPQGQAPRFLYPLSGDIPAGWDVRAAPTQLGRVALGPLEAGRRALRIEGAWDTQVNQGVLAQPGRLHVAEASLRGRSSPGNDAALALAFLDAEWRLVGEYRTAALPKGECAWRTVTLAEVAPAGARYVVVSLVALRQFGGDWLEARDLSLRVAGARTEDGR